LGWTEQTQLLALHTERRGGCVGEKEDGRRDTEKGKYPRDGLAHAGSGDLEWFSFLSLEIRKRFLPSGSTSEEGKKKVC
jgi:hypothetical protein